jgi:hypothetical protein
MVQEDKSQSSSEKKKTAEVSDKVTISESVYVRLERVDKLQEEAKKLQEEAREFKKRAELLESEVKKDEESLKEIKRKYNIT